ncbi:dienelactone hydrolase family protein [Aetokthonos hydrillicola Thurmond2011]|jgi:carboxymethylenebutenolidase|uniref:Dienelactone hydrolase family protein n=1 Tax=Aetokthonos hydrillicola Thurmond2011 TaxID=2712845 RepID=A0AAP5MDC5_9CYAN|nr:dienelactone hydrolase family protein [Aetokthonos hydrillicola]MBO3462407.1 dienelactone hydrolase family protein [Aetokthonos hydrillicola CCALA 1050]MBW4590615.1 dienelactone hydrolase family protein [Aetokthonos hydrillicola CCALA 1050]MDR9900377.1 dienelactone hydrolase family protein [Aetokthonos hydrillicola Thurmond2011]
MTNIEVKTTYVKIPNGDLQIEAYLAQPLEKGSFGAVIVFQEIFGVNENIRDITELIAQQGYVAIAPAMFQRIAPGFEFGFSEQDIGYSPQAYELGLQYYQQVKYWEIMSDIQATIAYLKTLPNVKPDSIGCIGFCFGGHVAYMAATLTDIKATASFYGAGITTPNFGEETPTIDRTLAIKGAIYTFFATKDSFVSEQENLKIESELKKHRINHRVFRYDTGHGFFGGLFIDKYPFLEQNPNLNQEAAMDAWKHVLHLFQDNLKN